MLSFTDLAVELAEADDYATARAWANWTGTDEVKTAALRRGQDFIAGEYNDRWVDEWENDDAPENVKFAIIEAARRELVSPGSTAPDITPGTAKILTQVDTIGWTPAKANITAADMVTTFKAIERLLTGLITNSSTAFLERA